MIILMALLGCTLSAHKTGLITVEDATVSLMEQSGQRCVLRVDAHGQELQYLDGCMVEVMGPRLGRQVFVRQWKVTDAGDGSQPFLGELHRMGMRWVLNDWSTQTTVILAGDRLAGIEQFAGQPILVVGFVAGPQEVTVVSWRVLSDAEQGEGR